MFLGRLGFLVFF